MDIPRVADQAWIALALLHAENPERSDFRTDEVLARAKREFGPLAPGVRQHLSSHAVASIAPSTGKYRMVTRTGRGRLRLFRTGDPVHDKRSGKSVPHEDEIPTKHRRLLSWYNEVYNTAKRPPNSQKKGDPRALLKFVGTITAYDLDLMTRLIEQDCERIEDQSGEGVDVA